MDRTEAWMRFMCVAMARWVGADVNAVEADRALAEMEKRLVKNFDTSTQLYVDVLAPTAELPGNRKERT